MMVRILKCILLPFALLIFLIVKLISLVYPVKISGLRGERIGHLVFAPDMHLRTRDKESIPGKYKEVFIVGTVVNRAFLNLIKRRMFVIEGRFFFLIYSLIKKVLPNDSIWFKFPRGHYSEYIACRDLDLAPPPLAFSEEEENKGLEILKKIGIRPDEPYVCFHGRDGAYMKKTFTSHLKDGWHYQSFRNSDIQNTVRAMELIKDKNLKFIRMGSVPEKSVVTEDPRIIDYAEKYRDDFSDIYLLGHCKFFVGDTSGVTCVPWLFNIPVVNINLVPLKEVPVRRVDLFLFKKYWYVKEQRFLTIKEIIDIGADNYFMTSEFEEAGIKCIENTHEEIHAVVDEMRKRLNGGWRTTKEDEMLQERYKSLWPEGHPTHGFLARVGAAFLRENRDLLK